ncbi:MULTISPECIES: tannase/feruloyl esterase family alpha/beta hydrolase [Vibrio]|uniref:Tannase/feruloyl esterase family alpha/beta hydrolase n=2 Tax=Vibrio TaxID=662 RepID=A0A7X4LK82_9VIBR|nr:MULTISPECIES: tannase/feruloyl esterase family alpha/beta hydrolase [Vibrio]MBF8999866.1 tannase/feruloyl esterase family alpha/beta hydrolase [Vibrio nitrifigilis]MZI93449.1 tannase/feruloyl esterase family alpha/beta hydrolase [Vibrio eleionomae]
MKIKILLSAAIALMVLVGCSHQHKATQNHATTTDTLTEVSPVADCASLSQVDLVALGGKGSQVLSAKETKDQQGHVVCQVKGTLAPTISFTVQLPKQGWSQRYMQLGCGGLCGRVDLRVGAADQCPLVLGSNMVLAATDMGHDGPSSDFGDNAQKRIDFAYRSVHITSLAAKTLIRHYYGQNARYSYFNGCSDGGREALMEAQRFPKDFNGIIAGAPAMNFSVQNSMHHGWLATVNTGKDGQPLITADDVPLIHQAVLDQCDALDGLKDGLLSDPRQCHFNPQVLSCKKGQTEQCLTQDQITALKRIYAGPHDPKTGIALTLGAPLPGSELAWPGVFVPRKNSSQIFSTMIAESALQKVLFEHNPQHFSLSDLKFNLATFDKLRPLYGMYSAVDPDLKAFKAYGGKLILWHGWSDQHISPINSIAYYEAVKNYMGAKEQSEFMNFYLIPGMHHCFGGDGPSSFDLLTPLTKWVEQGQKPDGILTTQTSKPKWDGAGAPEKLAKKKAQRKGKPGHAKQGKVLRTRPVYPFPYVAVYNGSGDVNQAVNFHKAMGTEGPATYSWAGAEYYDTNKQLNCQPVNNQLQCTTRKEIIE